jgi:potassium efflux system protein
MFRVGSFCVIAFMFFSLAAAGSARAADGTDLIPADQVKKNAVALDGIEASVTYTTDEKALARWAAQIGRIKSGATACVASAEKQLNGTETDLKTLGPKVAGEDIAVTRKRLALEREKAALQKQLASCRLLVLRSDEVLAEVNARSQVIVARHLLLRGPPIGALLSENWRKSREWISATRSFIVKHSGIRAISPGAWAAVAVMGVLVGWLSLWLRRRIGARPLARPPTGFADALRRAFSAVTARYAPRLLVSITVAGLVWILSRDLETTPFVGLVAYGLPAYFLLAALIELFLAPPSPAVPFLPVDGAIARAVARRLKILARLVYLGYLLFSTLLWQSLPEPALLLTRAIFAAVLVPNVIWSIWLFRRLTRIEELNWLRAAASVLLVVALAAEWLGYRNLSVFLLGGIVGTMMSVGIALLLSRLFRELYEGLAGGSGGWYQEARRLLGLAPGAPFPGLTWLRFLTTLAIWAGALLLVLATWGVADDVLAHLRDFFLAGFAVGSLRIVPSRILLALLILGLLLPAGRWLRTRLEKRWLKKTYLERGAREALVTISGYSVVGIAVVLALGVAGMDFGNLAIIAGALSVGIGFGLQNIVNNFVSGLILLFERPVKTGDWIIVGTTEGYVRRISIRSTQIQTFDRADVIVPNSELISTQVTNWMLRDKSGRVTVAVGVAYGSDTKRVKEVLLEVARNHPQVVVDSGRLPQPTVLFRRFGDSSLDFELRCFIHNIDNRLTVISDLNFAIDQAFRDEGIEIPFPQRDLHIKGWPSQDLPPGG